MNDHSVLQLADAKGRRLLGAAPDSHMPAGPRAVMDAVLTAVTLVLHPRTSRSDEDELVHAAGRWTSDLEALQMPDGLFTGGDNLASPPDSAFSINAAAIAVRLLQRGSTRWPDDLEKRLLNIVSAAAPALREGGVHTPNHRWELAAALAQSGTLLTDPALLQRARAWLDEGIDVDDDGLYSERSPNYAAHVSNPALTILADLLDRPDLLAIVHRNLHAHLDLTDDTGSVETLHSRRQDQWTPFPLGAFLAQLRRAAIQYSCPRCAHGARRAEETSGIDPVDVLSQQLLDPALAGTLPHATAAERDQHDQRRYFSGVRVLRDTRPSADAEFLVYGGSDVPAVGRIASGLACNPTFLRMRLGEALIESIRLSRDFFGLGPFRATDMTVAGDRIELAEHVHASYYQPLPARSHRDDGHYRLEHEGRFAAAMSFSDRTQDTVSLTTSVHVDLFDDGVDLVITTDGPATAHSLEISLAPGSELLGATPLDGQRFELVDGMATYTRRGTVVRIGPGTGTGPDRPPGYHPGEAYTLAKGTDAVGGIRLYLTWRSPGTVSVQLRGDGPGSHPQAPG